MRSLFEILAAVLFFGGLIFQSVLIDEARGDAFHKDCANDDLQTQLRQKGEYIRKLIRLLPHGFGRGGNSHDRRLARRKLARAAKLGDA